MHNQIDDLDHRTPTPSSGSTAVRRRVSSALRALTPTPANGSPLRFASVPSSSSRFTGRREIDEAALDGHKAVEFDIDWDWTGAVIGTRGKVAMGLSCREERYSGGLDPLAWLCNGADCIIAGLTGSWGGFSRTGKEGIVGVISSASKTTSSGTGSG